MLNYYNQPPFYMLIFGDIPPSLYIYYTLILIQTIGEITVIEEPYRPASSHVVSNIGLWIRNPKGCRESSDNKKQAGCCKVF